MSYRARGRVVFQQKDNEWVRVEEFGSEKEAKAEANALNSGVRHKGAKKRKE